MGTDGDPLRDRIEKGKQESNFRKWRLWPGPARGASGPGRPPSWALALILPQNFEDSGGPGFGRDGGAGGASMINETGYLGGSSLPRQFDKFRGL